MISYLAGPYRGKNWLERQINIAYARAVAKQLWSEGKTVICPHMNSANFDKCATDKQFLDGYLEILSKCDEVLLLPGWNQSEGTKAEIRKAVELKIPVKVVRLK